MNVKKMVEKFLTDGHFDGLCNVDAECGCHMGDLFPCGEYFAECEPGYRRIKDETCTCQSPDDCIDFCICKEKKVKTIPEYPEPGEDGAIKGFDIPGNLGNAGDYY